MLRARSVLFLAAALIAPLLLLHSDEKEPELWIHRSANGKKLPIGATTLTYKVW